MSQTDTTGWNLWPRGQDQWNEYAKLCSCGCSGLAATCTTPIPDGPARDLTDEEEEREALGEWALARMRAAEPLSPEEEEMLF